jgi:saccharopine dehydrogenase-like NADP-dependent oxidoreductase
VIRSAWLLLDLAAYPVQTPYVDVCDDVDYSWRAKGLHEQAKASGVPVIITVGICPGVSNGIHSHLPLYYTTSIVIH